MQTNELFDVLVVGYGPSGATLANLMGQAGHRVAVAETHAEIFDKPRAINLDQEALRLWQRIGLAAKISDGCAHHPGTDFLGVDGEPIKSIYSAPAPYPLGWPANVMFVQPEAERHLRERVDTLDSVSVFLEHTAKTYEEHADHIAVTFDTPDDPKTLRARYLVGCDGANSPTREWLGITQTDLGFSEHYVVIDAWVTRDTPLPARTTQYCRPDAPTSYVICSGNLRRWELKILPDENPYDYLDQEKINKRLASFVDVSALKFWRGAVYLFRARVADKWRDGRVFLAGDAAHTMPPFLGQGLNSGLRDVGNLWWKLSSALKDDRSAGLLDTYEVERRPHIMALTEITKELGLIVGETDPAKAAARDVRLRAEMKDTSKITVRQDLIPPICAGFIDQNDKSGLAGHLAPQPNVMANGGSHLLDDLLVGFSIVHKEAGEGDVLSVTTNLEAAESTQFTCMEQHSLFADFCAKHAATCFAVRPDGTIWGVGSDPAELKKKLMRALKGLTVF
jgi:3-(3-hydroxy-phenyl)propionate hydroxylase